VITLDYRGGLLNMKKEYIVFKISPDVIDTEKELNELAEAGWKLVCSYAWHNNWLIMERNKTKGEKAK